MPWELTGNSGTNPETNFLGTRDNQPLVIRTNGAQAVHIDGSGSVGIGGGTFAPSHVSISEFGQGRNVLLNLRRIERQVEEGEPPAPGLDVHFILDPTNRVFHLDLGGEANSRARIHLGDPAGPDNPVTTLGNVGIGTTTPREKLEVTGNMLVTDSQRRQVFKFDSASAVLDLGATGNEGDLRIRGDDGATKIALDGGQQQINVTNAAGVTVFRFDAGHALLDLGPSLGGAGAEADLRIWGADGEAKIHLDGNEGDIKLLAADCAEDFDVSEVETAEPGTVMVIAQESALKPSEQPYDKRVAGVVSGGEGYKPGIILDKQKFEADRIPVALMGKVACKVDARSSPIEVGDLLTTSSTPGHAMKAADPFKAFGAVLGKALRPLKGGQGLIPVLVALQ